MALANVTSGRHSTVATRGPSPRVAEVLRHRLGPPLRRSGSLSWMSYGWNRACEYWWNGDAPAGSPLYAVASDG
jgi:hypothetical protein